MSKRAATILGLAGGAALVLAAIAPAQAGGAASAIPRKPRFTTIELKNSAGQAEPRLTVVPSGRVFVDTNDKKSGTEVVYRSGPYRRNWRRTETTPPNQTKPTTDVDIV